ncbi:MAG TPA: hypothetical protein EYQ60_00535 [Myxococcales bacterium]|nr:hypothetical protein [Myxococcales bacterium]HIK85601.1 hypothetical protein [Myxococcales bacterium]
MDRESVQRLRFDSRLKTRAGWVDSSTEDAYLAALEDVSEKMTTCGEEDDASEVASAPPSTPELQTEASTPLAGDFSTSAAPPSPPAAPSSTTSSVPPTSPISRATASPEPSTPRDQGSAGTFPGETAGGAGSFGRDTESGRDTE